MSTQSNKIYFSGLNSLRFWAAFLVIISHIEMLKENYGFEIIISDFNFYYLGGISVTFFFVLSGFLITYLLLIEKEKHKNINIKAFYLRRILRIWPVYYSMLLLAFFVLPHIEAFQESYFASFFEEHFTTNILLYLLILPNVSFAMYPAVPNIGQFWSIGVEEQFYLAWPLIIKKSKNILRTLTIILICIIGIKLLILLMGQFYEFSLWYFSLKRLVAMSKFECMCIGGIGAYWLFTENKFLKILQKKTTLIITLVLIPILFVYVSGELQDGLHVVFSVMFLIILLYIVKTKSRPSIENKYLNYLGKISYGLYMYHFAVISVVLHFAKKHLSHESEYVQNLIIYVTVFVLTIIVASLSYRFVETPFIKLKSKHSPVKSGD